MLDDHDLTEDGWIVVDFRDHGRYFGPATLGECMAYIADDAECPMEELSIHDKEAFPHTVSSDADGNTGLAVQPANRGWIHP